MPHRLAIAVLVSLPLVTPSVPAFGQSPPEAVDDLHATAFEETLSVDPPGVLGNDSDPDGDPFEAVLVSPPDQGGSLRLDPDGAFEYEPPPGFTGIDTFVYRAADLDGESGNALVAIEVGLGGGGGVQVYTDETVFLSDLAALGLTRAREEFEDDATWGDVRSDIVGGNHTAPAKTRLGITWTSNNDTSEVTTSEEAARSGRWGFYSLPHGDYEAGVGCEVPGVCGDGWISTGAWTLFAAGGWVRTNTPPAKIQAILDGDFANPVDFGEPVLGGYGFYGVIAADGFATFEIREVEGTRDDQKFVFGDDFSFGVAPGLRLAASGACPGEIVVDLVGATPGGSVALVGAATPGTTVVPGGPCPGVVLDLAAPRLLATLGIPPSGAMSVIRTLGGGVCGRLLQALDLTTCGTSEVAGLP